MRYLVLLLIVCSAFKASAATDSIPNGNPLNYQKDWQRWSKQVVADSGVATLFVDTSAKVKAGYGMIRFFTDHKPYYWDGTGWRGFAVPITGFVQYSDSTGGTYVTLTRLKDSLGNYVTLHTTQTVSGSKTWSTDATFNDTVNINGDIVQANPSHTQSVFSYTDSLKYVDADGAYIFKNRISGLNKDRGVNPLLVARQRFYLKKAVDTLLLSGTNATSLNVINAFLKKSNSDDTVKVTALTTGNPYLKSISVGLEVTTDTSLIPDRTTYWKLNLPFALNYSYTGVTNHGHIDTVVDYDIGNTYYLNGGSSDSLFTIGRHEGLRIENLSGNAINQKSAAINQVGGLDSVIFHSRNIQLNNLPTSLTPAYRILADASGNLLQKTYLSGSATLDFPSTDSAHVSDLTITVTGATNGDPVYVGVPNAAVTATATYFGWVSSANTITIRFSPKATENPASATFKVVVTPL